LSVVLPCLNEEKTIGICIDKIKKVFLKENISGEIIVVDNGSSDSSREIALKSGAKVFIEEKKGYGAAYIRGLSQAKGKYIIIGDSDDTYDFYEIPKFLKPLKDGYDFVIGSRFKGQIKKGAMSWSHRYIGNPILSGLCRLLFRTKLSDIHCGMRAFTLDAYKKMQLMTTGMEFATEMVVSALVNNLKIYEVPISYHPRVGESKLRSLADAWRHIRFMLLYCPLWLYFIPGIFGFSLGIISLFVLLGGPFLFLGHRWDIHLMVLASLLSILSYQILHLGVYAHTYAIRQGFIKYDKLTLFFQKHFNLERGLILGGILFLIGLGINIFILLEWLLKNFGQLYRIREAILALTFLVIGLQTIFSSFFISLLFIEKRQ
ncbi:MAG: glycosyltransferase family 2 protein, partial [Candidatus Omnitrophica bacterium]|nr:glycosyltransferase family 2 protein [Candidatus Omnitrophota bacterium]